MDASAVISLLKQRSSPAYLAGMAKFGIANEYALGVKIPDLRQIAKQIKKNHQLAQELWRTGIHEARILASMIDDPERVTAQQIDAWVADFNSWDVCDQVCGNLFDRTPYALTKAVEYSAAQKEFVKRAGFALMAESAVHNKKADDLVFIKFLPIIAREAADDRNFVKKAVNWALRQIGKRNANLRTLAIATAEDILQQDSRAAKWIAGDALRELRS